MPVIVTSAASSRWSAAPSAAFATIAAWLSSGTMGFRTPAGARFGVVPIAFVPIALALAAGGLVFLAGRRDARRAAIAASPLILVVLPWLPAPLPAAFLIWTGALIGPIWIGVALALLAIVAPAASAGSDPSPRRELVRVALAGCVVFGTAAWLAAPAVPGGDEPHYLIITQSLLHDHSLNIERVHARGDYHAYFGGTLTPDFRTRGHGGEIYSIHAPGVPALVLPAFALAGYHGVVVFLILLSALTGTLAWWLAWRATGSRAAAWFGWAAVALAAPYLLETFTVYPDGPGAAAVLTAFWALQRLDRSEPISEAALVGHGAALAALPWMHTRFVLLAVVLGACLVWRLVARPGGVKQIAALLSVPAVSGVAWLASFYVMYGTPNPTAPYGGESDSALAFMPNGLGGLLFDQGFGLIATAPALALALAGLTRVRRFAVAWGLTAIVYGAAVSTYAMWWAGSSGPARFLVPLIPPLAIPAAAAWRAAGSRGARALMLTALIVSVWLSMVMAGAGGGLLGYHGRNVYGLTAAPWLEWANHLVDLPLALPAFVPLPAGTPLGARMAAAQAGYAATLPWLACFAAVTMAVVALDRHRGLARDTLLAASVGGCAVAAMIAATVVWWMHDARPLTPVSAQLDLLRRISDGPALSVPGLSLHPTPVGMRIEIPMFTSIPLVPAGSYVVATRSTLPAAATVFAGADDEAFRLMTVAPPDFARGVTIDLPVAVRALSVRTAPSMGAGLLELKPQSPRGPRASERTAHHAAAYGSTQVFFLDDRTAPEEDGFWIWGGREAELVFAARDELRVVLRNGASANAVTIRTDGGEERLTLQPGEERAVAIPGGARLTTIRTSAGFRPSDVDPRSQDQRYLGVFVVMPEHALR
jgi:hypothetical protein